MTRSHVDAAPPETPPLTVRLLVVDDHASWRRSVRAIIADSSTFQIVGEAGDGLEAIEKVESMKPDVVLLDVGLPSCDGIKTAARILSRASATAVVFVSEHRTREVVGAALATGARGYVLKSDGPAELIAAVNAVSRGHRFISRRLACGDVTGRRRHEVVFYDDEVTLLDDYSSSAAAALERGVRFMVLACESRRAALRSRLVARGIDVDRAMREGRYVTADPRDLISRFVVDGCVEEARFREAVAGIVPSTAASGNDGRPSLIVCGECAPTLLSAGHEEAALHIEQLWDAFADANGVETLCGYLMPMVGADRASQVAHRLCAAHSAVRASSSLNWIR